MWVLQQSVRVDPHLQCPRLDRPIGLCRQCMLSTISGNSFGHSYPDAASEWTWIEPHRKLSPKGEYVELQCDLSSMEWTNFNFVLASRSIE